MRALTVQPGQSGSARLERRPQAVGEGESGGVLLRPLAVGICGTDREIIEGHYGTAPPGKSRLVLGHECVARVESANGSSVLAAGDLVVPIVRRPDPVPCANCAVGEWDMCRNGLYTECGIKALDGFCAESARIEEQYLIRVAPGLGQLAVLVEPTSIVAKAWEHIERIGQRAHWAPRRVLVTGAGSVGLLAALLARQRGLEVHVFDRETTGPKPALVRALGGIFDGGDDLGALLERLAPDVVLECTGAAAVVVEVMVHNGRGAITCLVGVSASGRPLQVDVGALNRSMVLENDVVFGTVNANRRHYEAAAHALEQANAEWIGALISRRVPLERWSEALERRQNDVKVLLTMSE